MATSNKKKSKQLVRGKNLRRQITIRGEMPFNITFKEISDLAKIARKNIFRFVNQFRKIAMKRGLPWPQE